MRTHKTLAKLAIEGQDGRHWYAAAKQHIEHVSRVINCDPQRFADILALTSPKVSVSRNIKHALKYLTTGTHNHDVMRAVRTAVHHYEATGEIRGPKTSAFAAALMGDGDAVVLDVWMARALDVAQQTFRTKAARECERRLRKVAATLGWSPAETQAAIWTATIRQHGRTPAPFDILSLVATNTADVAA